MVASLQQLWSLGFPCNMALVNQSKNFDKYGHKNWQYRIVKVYIKENAEREKIKIDNIKKALHCYLQSFLTGNQV